MSSLIELPEGTTHVQSVYAQPITFLKAEPYTYLNTLIDHPEEQWQKLTGWFYHRDGKWITVGSGFSDRKLISINEYITSCYYTYTDLDPTFNRMTLRVEYNNLQQPIYVRRGYGGDFVSEIPLRDHLLWLIEKQSRLCRIYVTYGDGFQKCIYWYEQNVLDQFPHEAIKQ
jgi:hypothetical protein